MPFLAPVPTLQVNADTPGSVFANIQPARCSFCGGEWGKGKRPTYRTVFEDVMKSGGSRQVFNCGCTKDPAAASRGRR